MADLYWDPFAPELRDDPYPLWKRFRDEAPVWHNDRYDFWVLSRYSDIEEAHRDHDTFLSGHGTVLEQMSDEPIDTGMLLYLDPPKHTLLRKLVSRAFTTRRVSAVEDRVREVCAALLDPYVGSSGFDFVRDFSAILPPTIISHLIGVPPTDRDYLRKLVDDVFHIEPGVGMGNQTAIDALAELGSYLSDQFEERKAQPRDDMFTDLLHAEIPDNDGTARRLTDQELMEFTRLLFAAGTETVTRTLGWAADLMDRNRDARAELVADRALLPKAVEEILRFEPPSPVNVRWVANDVTIHDVPIPARAKLVMLNGSAGRDERKFADPDRLDIHRPPEVHFTFGYGIHFCLGAALARMEVRIGLDEVLARWPEWEVDRDNAEMLYTSTVRGHASLPLLV